MIITGSWFGGAKELMEEKAFDKISVGDICEKCDMNCKSFYYHFRELLLSIIATRLQDILCVDAIQDFQVDFFADAFVIAFQRWIIERGTMPPEEFLKQIRVCIKYLTIRYENIE